MTHQGWLRDSKNRWALHFLQVPKAFDNEIYVYIDKWNVSSIGTPEKFIDRRKVALLPAIETWNELVGLGWSIVDKQFGMFA